jgi:hypothetical protein
MMEFWPFVIVLAIGPGGSGRGDVGKGDAQWNSNYTV